MLEESPRENIYADALKTTLKNIHIYPTPPLGQDMTQGQFLSGV